MVYFSESRGEHLKRCFDDDMLIASSSSAGLHPKMGSIQDHVFRQVEKVGSDLGKQKRRRKAFRQGAIVMKIPFKFTLIKMCFFFFNKLYLNQISLPFLQLKKYILELRVQPLSLDTAFGSGIPIRSQSEFADGFLYIKNYPWRVLGDLGSTSGMEDGRELRLDVMRGRKERSTVASTTVRRWMLSGPLWKREIKFKSNWCDMNIETYMVDRTQNRIYPRK